MKSIPKLICRYVGILLFSCILILILNFVLLFIITVKQAPNGHPWTMAEEVADVLQDDGGYDLPHAVALELKSSDAWTIFIDNETKQVTWISDLYR